MDGRIYWRLSLMMFLQFFVWGAWFVTLGTHLGHIGFSGSQIGYAYLMNNIAAVVSPFFVGMIADRFFASQKVMGVLHLAGAVILYLSADLTAVGPLILGLFLYNLTYMPTLALVNAVSFLAVMASVVLMPEAWQSSANRPPPTLMTITLGGGSGIDTPGRTISERPVQEEEALDIRAHPSLGEVTIGRSTERTAAPTS